MVKTRNEKLAEIPKLSGVYIMRDGIGDIIYIGKAVNLKNRISSYFHADGDSKAASIITAMRKIDYILCASESEALIVERQLINRIKPYFNSMWKDDKSYPYIKITKEDFPRLLITRKKLKDGGLYFGPYPRAYHIKKLARWLSKLFKMRPCRLEFGADSLPDEKKVKSCIYLHTGMCPGPCLGRISPSRYKRAAREAEFFLSGKFRKLESQWESRMYEFSSKMEFEQAKEARDRLFAIRSMGERVMIKEITLEDIEKSVERSDSINELKQALGLKCMPAVIEGFDNSNMQGAAAVSSMVRFTNGLPDKKNYRRFRVKTVTGADDFATMREVVFRRYSGLIRKNEKMPDLVLIDGGKGQLQAAKSALDELQLQLPVISLAERNEEIYMPHKDRPLVLSRHSPALRLLQSIRDESHRFAINYHRKLREKIV